MSMNPNDDSTERLRDRLGAGRDQTQNDSTQADDGGNDGVPDDINQGRRVSRRDTGTADPGGGAEPERIPDGINRTNRQTGSFGDSASENVDRVRNRRGAGRDQARDAASSDSGGGGGGGSSSGTTPSAGPERIDVSDPGGEGTQRVESAAGLGTGTTNQVGPQQTERDIENEVRGQITDQVIRDSAPLDFDDDVRVENIRQVDTDDGPRFTGDVRLTDQGRERVQESQLDAIRSRGTTGRVFASRQLRRQADDREGVSGSDITGDFSGDTLRGEFTTGGRARQEELAEQRFSTDLRNEFARQQFAEEVASQRDGFTASDFDVSTRGGDVGVELSTGGRSRQGIRNAVDQTGFDREDFTTTVRDGEVQPTLTDEAFKERVASQEPDIDADDLEIGQRDAVVPSDRRLFEESGRDVVVSPDAATGEQRRVASLTPEAQAQQLNDRLQDEYPNAESIEIYFGEDGDPYAEVTTEGEVSRAVRLSEQFVADPTGSTIEGSTDIVSGSSDALTQLGDDSVEAVSNPVRTSRSVSDDFVAGSNELGSEFVSGVQRDAGTVADIGTDILVGGSQVAAGGRGQGAATVPTGGVGGGLVDFGSDVARTSGELAALPVVAAPAGAATGAALAEPTPLGEVAVGTAAGAGVAGVALGVAGAEATFAADRATQSERTRTTGELGIGGTTTEVTELDVGENARNESELETPVEDRGSELEVGGGFGEGELDVPEERRVEIDIAQLSGQQVVQRERGGEQTPEITEEDIADPFADPDQAPPSTRERQRRDDLNPFEREFPTGAGAVVGNEIGGDELRDQAQERSVDRTERLNDTETGRGAGESLFPPVAGDVTDAAVGERLGTQLFGDTASRPRVGAESAVDTATRTDLTLGQPSLFGEPAAPAFGDGPGFDIEFDTQPGFGNEFGTGMNRPRRRRGDDDARDDDPFFATREDETVFGSGIRDFDVDEFGLFDDFDL